MKLKAAVGPASDSKPVAFYAVAKPCIGLPTSAGFSILEGKCFFSVALHHLLQPQLLALLWLIAIGGICADKLKWLR